ncbi:MAG: hypothetical protein AAGF85_20920 [Bacteroidota bacterium]
MSNRFFTHTIIVLVLLLFIVSPPASGSDFQTVYDSAKKMRSFEIGERALELAEINGDEQQLAKAHSLIAFYQNEKGMYYQALNHYFSALFNYKKTRNYGRQIAMLKNIGIIYRVGGFYEKAIAFYKDAEALAVELNDIKRKRSIKYQIARIKRLSGDYKEAKAIYLNLIEQSDDFKNKNILSDTYLELALISGTHEKDFRTSQEYLDLAVQVYEGEASTTSNAQFTKLTRINDMAHFEMVRGRVEASKELLVNALDQANPNLSINKEILAKICMNLGAVYRQLNKPDSSVAMYEQGLVFMPLTSFDEKYIETANLLYKHYKAKSPEKMDHYHNLIYQYGLEFAELKTQLIQASQEYQIRAADYRRELDLRIAKEKRMLWWDIFFYALTFIIIASGIVFYRWEKKKRKKRLRKALDNARIIVPLSSKY